MFLSPNNRRAIVPLLSTAMFALGCLLTATAGAAVTPAKFSLKGKKAPDFVLQNSWGHKDHLYEWIGKKKVIVMNFGGHKSEKEATGTFVNAARMYYTHPGVKMISMIVLKDLPFYANRNTVIERVKEIGRNISYPELGGTLDWEGKTSAKFGVDQGPNVIVINKKGIVVYMQGDLVKGSTRALHNAVETALKEK